MQCTDIYPSGSVSIPPRMQRIHPLAIQSGVFPIFVKQINRYNHYEKHKKLYGISIFFDIHTGLDFSSPGQDCNEKSRIMYSVGGPTTYFVTPN